MEDQRYRSFLILKDWKSESSDFQWSCIQQIINIYCAIFLPARIVGQCVSSLNSTASERLDVLRPQGRRTSWSSRAWKVQKRDVPFTHAETICSLTPEFLNEPTMIVIVHFIFVLGPRKVLEGPSPAYSSLCSHYPRFPLPSAKSALCPDCLLGEIMEHIEQK